MATVRKRANTWEPQKTRKLHKFRGCEQGLRKCMTVNAILDVDMPGRCDSPVTKLSLKNARLAFISLKLLASRRHYCASAIG